MSRDAARRSTRPRPGTGTRGTAFIESEEGQLSRLGCCLLTIITKLGGMHGHRDIRNLFRSSGDAHTAIDAWSFHLGLRLARRRVCTLVDHNIEGPKECIEGMVRVVVRDRIGALVVVDIFLGRETGLVLLLEVIIGLGGKDHAGNGREELGCCPLAVGLLLGGFVSGAQRYLELVVVPINDLHAFVFIAFALGYIVLHDG
mmetsp:Transcript_159/g.411  ORF Transcript_159/g.411 Transcript_159/m.411 type:complete len:201 (-) Transcript_159:313-915(-)